MRNTALKCLIGLICVPFFAIYSLAQDNFDVLTFTAPKGWARDASPKGDLIHFSKEDRAKNAFAMITVFKAIPASADSKTNFDLAWANLAKNNMGAAAPQMSPVDHQNEWEVQSGIGTFQKDGLQGIVLLATATAENKMANVLFVTNSEIYQADAQNFFASVKLPQIRADKIVKVSASSTTSLKNFSPEIWYSYQPTLRTVGEYRFQFFAIYPNGDALASVPAEGLLGVSRETRPQYVWGRRKDIGNEVHDEYANGSVRKMGKLSATKMSYPAGSKTSYYIKLNSVDGTKLDGEFAADSPDWFRNGKAPDIVFRSDGSFVSKMTMRVYDATGKDVGWKDNGSGSYFIKDFTIVFTYSDGTVCRRQFCMSLEDAGSRYSNVIFLADYPMWRNMSK